MDYTLNQFSLKEYSLTNNTANTLYYSLSLYKDEKYEDVDSGTVEEEDISWLHLEEDGVYRLLLSFNSEFDSLLSSYIIHNITEVLETRQQFLTKLLTEYKCKDCTHNHYYDFLSFSVLFDTYNSLVKDSFFTSVTPKNLYKISYLLEQLKAYN